MSQSKVHIFSTHVHDAVRMPFQLVRNKHAEICNSGLPACCFVLDYLYRVSCRNAGGTLAPGWRVEIKTRNSGTTAGSSDAVSFMLDLPANKSSQRRHAARHWC